MIKTSPSIVNIYSIDMTKYQEVFSAESQSILLKKPLFTKIRDEENDLPSCDTEHLCAKFFFLIFGKRLFQQNHNQYNLLDNATLTRVSLIPAEQARFGQSGRLSLRNHPCREFIISNIMNILQGGQL